MSWQLPNVASTPVNGVPNPNFWVCKGGGVTEVLLMNTWKKLLALDQFVAYILAKMFTETDCK